MTATRIHVTGGFGSSARNKGFPQGYDLPDDTADAETCASVAFVFWTSAQDLSPPWSTVTG